MTKVKQLANNQFIIEMGNISGSKAIEYLQSYDSIIAKRHNDKLVGEYFPFVELDKTYWNYSKTTSKYRNKFLGETTKETQAKIDSGEYTLTDLNQ